MPFAEPFLIKPGTKVKLTEYDPAFTADVKNKAAAVAELSKNVERLSELQRVLYAENRRSLLIVLQSMDTGGKDGTIRHVMSGVNPQGFKITSFKSPSAWELEHDFLWRIHHAVPSRGMIGIFNRSHYEDVLIVRVHDMVPKAVWSKRYAQINRFEQNLAENGVVILKFFLHISKEEQKQRLMKRITNPDKNWKIDPQDFEERKFWDDYIRAYEVALSKCSPKHAPWYVIPADHKWFRNLAISRILVHTLEQLDLKYPKPKCDFSQITIE
jgi:PPK2 family polyphosphate:nucleotide phosphotransferase